MEAEKAEPAAGVAAGNCYLVIAGQPLSADERREICERPAGASGPSLNELVAMEFQRTAIPASSIAIQPPEGVTLVNLDTLFATDAVAFEEGFTLLGREVTLRITPVEFEWITGDGGSFTTTTPGMAYEQGRPMTDYVSWKYLQPAQALGPSVNVTWTAEFRIAGGDWLPVQGTVTTTGPAAELEVKEAVPVLVGGDG
ncbi:hypothetical protein [Nocardioides sp. AE5]|uniref:hypothetical protein n=1 Tax=Nocardioides sp. AE5 TaxID=2962573 RepID=UPI0028815E1C|nr:hypothetical protein [Nocardioides sp. AE5]MDT0203002.1 hypothetical protein [Nocardioides sp. AE5]